MTLKNPVIRRRLRGGRLEGRTIAGPLCRLTVVAGLALASDPVLANDSTAELGTGGLDFVENPNVEMRKEELFISPAEIRVTYRFFNKGDQPVTNLVAFPLPDVTIADQDTNIAVPSDDPVNFVQFATAADGKTVETRAEQKVFAKGIDRTELLRSLNIPLAPQLKSTYDALDALPKDKWQELIDLGIGEIAEYGTTADMKMQQHLEPRWTLKTTYYWQQTFPPGHDLVIEHRYKPSVGSTAGTGIGNPEIPDANGYQTRFCMDPGFVASVKRLKEAKPPDDAFVMEQRINYVLKTGANWAGPIADFTLTVDKSKPDNLISFCGDKVKKISPTQFQVHYTNFTPQSDLSVLIVTRHAPN